MSKLLERLCLPKISAQQTRKHQHLGCIWRIGGHSNNQNPSSGCDSPSKLRTIAKGNFYSLNSKRCFTTLCFKESGKTICTPLVLPERSYRKKSDEPETFHQYKTAMEVPEGLFVGKLDRFNGITIDSLQEFNEKENFEEKLQATLEHWSSCKRRGVWFKVATQHAAWIPILTKHKFNFHHAKQDYVMLNRWLPKDEPANIPEFAHTMVGVGGLVINDKHEVLVVSDRHGMIPGSWKLPGGYVDTNENLIEAVKREVKEETSIDTEFRSVVSFRHSHGGMFGSSDIYIVIALKPLSLDIKLNDGEISKLQWMPIPEYLEHPNVHETNRSFVRTYLDYEKRGLTFTGEERVHQILKKKYMLYYLKPSDENGKEDQGDCQS